MKGWKIGVGAAVGVAVGFAIAYFLDKEKREDFVEGFRNTTQKTKDSIVDGYYEARDRYNEYRNKLKREWGNMRGHAEEEIEAIKDELQEE